MITHVIIKRVITLIHGKGWLVLPQLAASIGAPVSRQSWRSSRSLELGLDFGLFWSSRSVRVRMGVDFSLIIFPSAIVQIFYSSYYKGEIIDNILISVHEFRCDGKVTDCQVEVTGSILSMGQLFWASLL